MVPLCWFGDFGSVIRCFLLDRSRTALSVLNTGPNWLLFQKVKKLFGKIRRLSVTTAKTNATC
jgi:hypothetical protein